MKHTYSPGFQELINSPERVKDLLVNCSFFGTFAGWERRKAFIANAIHKDGTFLDTGSGNGFLLRCLQEWSSYSITPFGIDINPEFIQKAKAVFPQHKDNFVVMDSRKINQISESLPGSYDFVFISSGNWWHSHNENEQTAKTINDLKQYVNPGGRLIIGFYGDSKSDNLSAAKALQKLGVEFSGSLENPEDTNLVAWIDKRKSLQPSF